MCARVSVCVRCTHVDALRFFAEGAKALNVNGDLVRKQQVESNSERERE